MASKRHIRKRTCEKKVGHETAQDARYALYIMNKAKGYCGNVYKCKFCNKYHVGRRKPVYMKNRIEVGA